MMQQALGWGHPKITAGWFTLPFKNSQLLSEYGVNDCWFKQDSKHVTDLGTIQNYHLKQPRASVLSKLF
jgi:hypothetical protein